MRPSSPAWALALFLILAYLFVTEFMLLGGINLGLLTEGALTTYFGLRGWASAGMTLLIAAASTYFLAFLFSQALRRR